MRRSPGCRSLKTPYFSVSDKNMGKVQKIIGERTIPPNPLTEKRGRLSGTSPTIIFKIKIVLYDIIHKGTWNLCPSG
jgi:hypothetical protein